MKNQKQTVINTFLTLTLIAVFASFAFAAPPANDNLQNAQLLSGNSGSLETTNAEATREANESSHAFGTDIIVRTVWYQFIATENKPISFWVVNNGTSNNLSMSVYTGETYPLTYVANNNDTNGIFPRIEFQATAGTTYKIVVGNFGTPSSANGGFTLNWQVNDAPSNDDFANALTLNNHLAGEVISTTQNATRETGEPLHINGSRSVWYKYTNVLPNDYSLSFETGGLSSPLPDTTIAVYTGSSLENLVPVVKNDQREAAVRISRATFVAKSNVTYWIAVDSPANSEFNVKLFWKIKSQKGFVDFGQKLSDGEVYLDGLADITLYRPTTGTWWFRNSTNLGVSAIQFGVDVDTPVLGDYDGDDITDLAVTRDTPGAGKIWYILNSYDNSYSVYSWGITGDKPVIGDYDGDGLTDLAVFRPSNGTWYIRRSKDGSLFSKQFGFSNDIPVAGDFEGTSFGTDIAVFRPSNGTWYVVNGNNTMFFPYGRSGDKPVVGDYDADGFSDYALFRPSEGTWYVFKSTSNQSESIRWGTNGDIPIVGNFNVARAFDYAVYRPSENRFYFLVSGAITANSQHTVFGLPGDIPTTSPILH